MVAELTKDQRNVLGIDRRLVTFQADKLPFVSNIVKHWEETKSLMFPQQPAGPGT